MVERLRRDVPIFGIGLCLVALAYAAITIASALQPGALGVDLHSYQDAARSWLAGDGFYHARQLIGPYQIVGAESPTSADVLYPPTLLWLLVPFTVLPDLLWWAIPAAMSAWALWLIRPSRWLWFGVLALLVFPPSLSIIVRGNPAMWLAAFTLLGVAYGWGGAFVLLKPSLLPFALIGVTGRKWWLVAGLLAALTLPLLPLLSQYPQVVLDSRGGGLLYSLGDVPLLSIPALAWISSRSRNWSCRLRLRLRSRVLIASRSRPSEPRPRPESP